MHKCYTCYTTVYQARARTAHASHWILHHVDRVGGGDGNITKTVLPLLSVLPVSQARGLRRRRTDRLSRYVNGHSLTSMMDFQVTKTNSFKLSRLLAGVTKGMTTGMGAICTGLSIS